MRVVLDVCAERSTRVWLVGGAMRDVLLGRPLHDFDLAVENDAIAIARDVASRLDAPMYILDAERDSARVVTFDAQGTRLFLDIVRLRDSTIEADLAQRDFTINAIAADLTQPERLIDPFDGQHDIATQMIRAVGAHSLQDDALRMLRAVRLAAALSFKIESHTAARIRAMVNHIVDPSAERVRDELAQIVETARLSDSLLLLEDLGLLPILMPEVTAMRDISQSPPHHWDVFEHTLVMLELLELLLARVAGIESQGHAITSRVGVPQRIWEDVDRVLGMFRSRLNEHFNQIVSDERPTWSIFKWAALFHDTGKPLTRSVDDDGRIRFLGHERVSAQLVNERMHALRFSSNEIERAAATVRHHMRLLNLDADMITRRATYRFYRDAGEAGIDVLLHMLADHLATHGPDLDQERWLARVDMARRLLDEYFTRHEETVSPKALISGHDVMDALGVDPGPHVGEWLEAVREAQAAGEVTTRAEALELAARLFAQTRR